MPRIKEHTLKCERIAWAHLEDRYNTVDLGQRRRRVELSKVSSAERIALSDSQGQGCLRTGAVARGGIWLTLTSVLGREANEVA